MNFSILHAIAVPDIPTARRLYELEGLDDASVSKVIYHLRKQAAGTEKLRWEQCMIGSLVVIRLGADAVEFASLLAGSDTEAAMLAAVEPLGDRGESLVTWDGGHQLWPLLRYRAIALDRTLPALWDATMQRDLCSAFSTSSEDRPRLGEIAERVGLPGISDCVETTAVEQWVAGTGEPLRTCTETGALKMFLLALRVFHATGELSAGDADRARRALAHRLSTQPGVPAKGLLASWGG